ncbi:MAG: plastocyanin/azurin family copper-binding protein [Solirubrobacteraceae bacterium]
MRTPKQFTILLSASALALGVAACGGSSSTSSSAAGGAGATSTSAPAGGAATTSASSSSAASAAPSSGASSKLAIAANPTGMLMFNKTGLTAKAGTVTIAFTNKSSLGHNLTIKSSSGSTMGATPTFSGGTKRLTLKLKPGTYSYLCTVPGHAAAGMKGTLTVT